jgi:drug/metabolite transporter (DMT)-like permease
VQGDGSSSTSSSPAPRASGAAAGGALSPRAGRGGLADAWPALAGALGFGLATPAAKAWLAGVPPLLASGGLYLVSGIGLGAWLVATRGRRQAPPLSRADRPWLAGAIAAGGVLAPYAFLEGLESTPAHVVSLLANLEVVFTTLLAVALFRERVDARRGAGIALVVLGSAWCAWLVGRPAGGAGGADALRGLEGGLLVALACFAWGLDNNLTRRIAGKDPVAIACAKGLVGGSVSLALGFAIAGGSVAPPAAPAWFGGVAIALVGYALSLTLFIRSLGRLGAARATALFGVYPFVGVVASAAFLGETLSEWTLAAGVVIAAGAGLLVLDRSGTGRGERA